MKHAPDRNETNYTSRGEVRTCDLCGDERRCEEGDGLVACRACQRELLPANWTMK